jgi:hypothetical protein
MPDIHLANQLDRLETAILDLVSCRVRLGLWSSHALLAFLRFWRWRRDWTDCVKQLRGHVEQSSGAGEGCEQGLETDRQNHVAKDAST